MDETTTGREAALAALAGTAVERLFLGGPLDGQVRTMAPDQLEVYAEDGSNLEDVSTFADSFTVRRPRPYRYAAHAFSQQGVGTRYVMVGEDVGDPRAALFRWLSRRWLAEAPERSA